MDEKWGKRRLLIDDQEPVWSQHDCGRELRIGHALALLALVALLWAVMTPWYEPEDFPGLTAEQVRARFGEPMWTSDISDVKPGTVEWWYRRKLFPGETVRVEIKDGVVVDAD